MLTTGTGSGKSLAYIVPIVDHVLAAKAAGTYRPGIKAIVVYPMNALANSQLGELEKFLTTAIPSGPPVTFDRYTGQESQDERARIIANPPDILLTNYVMLELVLTRPRERGLVEAARGLWFLVLDELHTYRGRQGADVALLVRRLRDACDAPARPVHRHVGHDDHGGRRRATSARQSPRWRRPCSACRSSPGTSSARRWSGSPTRRPSTPTRCASASRPAPPGDFAAFTADPLAAWIEEVFGFEPGSPAGQPAAAPPSADPARGGAAAG